MSGVRAAGSGVTPEYQVGLDGYYKMAKNLIDDGQFGAAPILSAFNYATGQICGVELSQSYTQKGLTAYANFAVEDYGDRTHLTSSGGSKLALTVAPEIRLLAQKLKFVEP